MKLGVEPGSTSIPSSGLNLILGLSVVLWGFSSIGLGYLTVRIRAPNTIKARAATVSTAQTRRRLDDMLGPKELAQPETPPQSQWVENKEPQVKKVEDAPLPPVRSPTIAMVKVRYKAELVGMIPVSNLQVDPETIEFVKFEEKKKEPAA